MKYEIYADSLFLVNLVMNLYCLELVNHFFGRISPPGRIMIASLTGALLYLVPFLLPGTAWGKLLLWAPLTVTIVILAAFRVNGFVAFVRIMAALLAVSFLFGGAILFLGRFLGEAFLLTSCGILLVGGLVFLGTQQLITQAKERQICRIELTGAGAKVTGKGLLDNGNHLVEPISGQPVCILEKRVFDSLWVSGKPAGFRAITYRSVGKESGLLYGYPIPQLRIEWNGMVRIFRNIYIGVSPENLSGQGEYCMIIPPGLLSRKEEKGGLI